MTTVGQRMIALALLCSVCACAGEKAEDAVWDKQAQALDKARQVEDVLMNRADRLVKDLESDDNQKDEKDKKDKDLR